MLERSHHKDEYNVSWNIAWCNLALIHALTHSPSSIKHLLSLTPSLLPHSQVSPASRSMLTSTAPSVEEMLREKRPEEAILQLLRRTISLSHSSQSNNWKQCNGGRKGVEGMWRVCGGCVEGVWRVELGSTILTSQGEVNQMLR